MNLHEISLRTKLSLTKLRSLEKLGVLKVDSEDDRLPALRLALKRGRLSTAHLVMLVEEPDLLYSLGDYAPRVEAWIEALGDTTPDTESRRAAVAVKGASIGDASDLATMTDWVKGKLTGDPVNFHYLAVRLVRAQFLNLREETVKRLNLAFARLRAMPDMAGWWSAKEGQIFYHVPNDL